MAAVATGALLAWAGSASTLVADPQSDAADAKAAAEAKKRAEAAAKAQTPATPAAPAPQSAAEPTATDAASKPAATPTENQNANSSN